MANPNPTQENICFRKYCFSQNVAKVSDEINKHRKSKYHNFILLKLSNGKKRVLSSRLPCILFLLIKLLSTCFEHHFPADNYMFKVNNRNNRTRCEICSKLTIKILERRQWRRSGIFIANFEYISHFVLVLLLLTLSR